MAERTLCETDVSEIDKAEVGAIRRSIVADSPLQTAAHSTEPFIWEARQTQHCADLLSGNSYRLMSYNILAGLYVTPEDTAFPYCPKEYQNVAYRYPLLLREIPGYKADIICLQEVDQCLSTEFLTPLLQTEGYEVLYRAKGQQKKEKKEGAIIAFRRSRFSLLSKHSELLSDLLHPENHAENGDLRSLISQATDTMDMVMTRSTIIQVAALKLTDTALKEDDREQILLIGNTHLHSTWSHEHAKVVQAALCLRHLSAVEAQLRQLHPRAEIAVVFTGDFNVVPSSAAVKLLSTGKLSQDDDVWQHGSREGRPFRGIDLSLGVGLHCASGFPPYTNFTKYRMNEETRGFEGTLDYIWTNQHVHVDKVIPLPEDELVKKHEALPSVIGPSDHLPIVIEVTI